MKLKKYYWKAVRKTKTKFCSAIVGQKAVLYYQIGKVTKHKFNNGVFCFKTREDARWFTRRERASRLYILKVKAVGTKIDCPIFSWLADLQVCGKINPVYMSFPAGTIAFTAIKPVAIVR